MSSFRRAFLYLKRKRIKTIILFFLILVLATLSLSALALKDAIETAQLNVRQVLGGYFTVEANMTDSDKWLINEYGGKYTGEMPTVDLAESVAENLDGLLGYNLYDTFKTRVSKEPGSYDLPFIICGSNQFDAEFVSDARSSVGSDPDSTDDYNISFGAHLCTDSAFDYYFMSGGLTLVEGRHIKMEETGVAIIGEEVAKLNGLKIGDTIYLRDRSSYLDSDEKPVYAPVTIVGLFKVNGRSNSTLSTDAVENNIFTTQNTLQTYSVYRTGSYSKIHFYAEDPDELEEMAETVSALPQFKDDGDFIVSLDNKEVLAVKKPLENIHRLVTLLIVLILMIGAVILWLILSSRIKERIREAGILLSIGKGKGDILLQYILEITAVTLVACAVSIFSGGVIAKTAANTMLEDTITNVLEEQQPPQTDSSQSIFAYVNTDDLQNPDIVGNTASTQPLTEISVSIQASDVLLLFIAALLLAWLAVFIASIPLFRLKPREILSKMS